MHGPTEGERNRRRRRYPISQVSGQRGGGLVWPAAFFLAGTVAGTGWDDAQRFTTCMSPPARGWSTSAAGTCRSGTARRSRNITPCGATPACSTCRTCARSTCAAPGCARCCCGCSRTTSAGSRMPGKALYSCMLRPDGGVIDDLIACFLDEKWFRLVVNAGTADKDIAWIREHAKQIGVAVVPRRDLAIIAVQGPNARAKTIPLLPEACRGTAARSAVLRGVVATNGSSRARGTRARTDSRSRCPRRRPRISGAPSRRPASRPAGWARATRCASRRA